MQHRLLLSLLVSSLALSACNLPAGQNVPVQPSVQQNANARPVLGSALLKRTLLLQRIDGQVVPVAAVTQPDSGFTLKQVSAGVAIATPTMAVSRPAIGPMYYYGGGEFNQYQIQYAEESIHKAATGGSLLTVYNQDIKPLLSEWDSDARLLESRAQLNGTEEEYIYLPGKEGEPLRLHPLYVFRFASTPKKETLNVYVLKGEIRVHRMVYGEPEIEIGRVRIDSDKAVEIARKAFANRDGKPGYPVYPEAQDANAQVIYDIPSDLKWNLQLNQQSKDQIRYFVNFSFERQVEGTQPPMPMPMPMEDKPMPVDLGATDGGSAPDGSAPLDVKPMPAYFPQQFYGSVEIDAVTGAIKSLNRPVWYGQIAYAERGDVAVGSSGGSAGTVTSVEIMPAKAE